MPRIYSILALLVSVALLLSWFAAPPDGRTGAPGDGLCSDCHTNQGSQTGTIVVTGIPASIEPCTQYTITVTNTHTGGTALLAGFEITILNGNNNMAGTISNPSQFSTLSMFNNRQYWKHMPAQSYQGNMFQWNATWTSPSGPNNTTITAYAAGNVANGNGNNQGDKIVTSQAVGTLNGGAPALSVNITSVNVLCNGQNTGSATANASGGIPPITYSWSNGGNTQTITNLVAGTYTVTVTDNCSSTATKNVVITQPAALVFTAPTITNVSCFGGNNGSITAHASGGVAPYDFNWSNGGTGATISNLVAGSYTVTVTDNNDCTKTATYSVTQPALIVINLVSLTHESCSGQNDGAITISVSGGVPPVFAEWSNGSIGMSITNLPPETYTVTVTDNNDCTKTASYTINEGSLVDVTLNQIHHVTCNGGNDGSISVTASGGTGPYTYSWSNGGNTSMITGLVAGSYLVTVTDSHGCSVTEGYTVNQPPAIVAGITQTSQNLCFGDATADLTGSASGGVPPYTALWSNGITGLINSNLPAGTYTITITDDNQCTKTASAIVTQPTQLSTLVNTTDETGVGANNGTATAVPAGGTPAYAYLWSNGATTQMITGLPPGTYCVTVTDMNGCTTTACGQVDAFGCSLDVLLPPDFSFCEGDTSIITPTINGASGTFTLLWTGGSTGNFLQISSGGEYCVTVTDQANCQDADCVIATEIIIPDFTCPVTNESGPGLHDGAINCDGLTGIAAFLWSNGATTSSITGLAPGQYCVTVTDANGCTKSQCFNVQPGNCQMSVTSTQTNVSCNGDSTGSITLIVTGGTAPITYIWSNGATTATISNLPAGTYASTVTDALGCLDTRSFEITQPPALSISVDSTEDIHGSVPGSIYVTISGGTPPYTSVWADPVGNIIPGEDLTGLNVAGCYTLGVTDAAACTTILDSVCIDMDLAVNLTPKFESLKVYPVPTDDVLFIDFEGSINEILISGIDGRSYKRILNPASNQIDVSNFDSGWYILRINDGKNWYIARMLK